MKAEILIGVSASGKTTYAMSMTDYAIVCRDDIRFGHVMPNARGWKDYVFSNENEQKVTAIHKDQIARCAELSQNLIVADTNLSKKNRRKLIKYLQEIGYEVDLLQAMFVQNGYMCTKSSRIHGFSKNVQYSLSVTDKT